MPKRPGSQFRYRVEPVHIRRSVRTTSCLPEFMSKGSNILMIKHMSTFPLRLLVRMVLLLLPGMLVRGQMFLLSRVLRGAMSMLGPFM